MNEPMQADSNQVSDPGSAPVNTQPEPGLGSDAAQIFRSQKLANVIDNPEFGLSSEALKALPAVNTPEHDYMMKLFRYD